MIPKFKKMECSNCETELDEKDVFSLPGKGIVITCPNCKQACVLSPGDLSVPTLDNSQLKVKTISNGKHKETITIEEDGEDSHKGPSTIIPFPEIY